jgi:multimeric flavodoxin WrbA
MPISTIDRATEDSRQRPFPSPLNGMNVSGLMKVFVDRFAYIFHRPRFFDKKAPLLATTGSIGTKKVLDYPGLVARI